MAHYSMDELTQVWKMNSTVPLRCLKFTRRHDKSFKLKGFNIKGQALKVSNQYQITRY